MWDSMGAGGVCFFYAKLLFNTVRLFKTDALEQVVFHAGRRNATAS